MNRLGNLDRLIQTLNVSLPDPATLLRHPQLLRRISSERQHQQRRASERATEDQTARTSTSPPPSSPSSSPHNQSVGSSNHSQSDDARNPLNPSVADQSASTNHKFPPPVSFWPASFILLDRLYMFLVVCFCIALSLIV